MTAPAPLFATDKEAAKELRVSVASFRRLVSIGAVPGPIRFGEFERWKRSELAAIGEGSPAIPKEDFEL